MKSGDLVGALKICRKCVPYLRQLIPHVNNANLQKYLNDTANRIEKFLASGPTMWALHTFFSAESKNLGGILGALVGAFVHFVDDVGGLVGNVLGSFLG